jgi:hypothetical protein
LRGIAPEPAYRLRIGTPSENCLPTLASTRQPPDTSAGLDPSITESPRPHTPRCATGRLAATTGALDEVAGAGSLVGLATALSEVGAAVAAVAVVAVVAGVCVATWLTGAGRTGEAPALAGVSVAQPASAPAKVAPRMGSTSARWPDNTL